TTNEWQDWYMWGSFIWLPTENDDEQLHADYDRVRELVQANRLDEISSKPFPKGPCKLLLPNTGGQDSSDKQKFAIGGEQTEGKRRAWFLHHSFTQRLVDVN